MKWIVALLFCLTQTAAAAELTGVWSYVTSYNEMPNGSKLTLFGNAPHGQFMLFPNGHYNHILRHRECVNPLKLQGCKSNGKQLSHFGTFEVTEKSFIGHVAWANEAQLIGKKQVRSVLRLDDESLVYINHLSIAGGRARVIATLKRLQ